MKKLLLSILFLTLAVGASSAQQPIYNPGAGTFSWTISEDTTQQMLGCPGNNYNAEGQCETGMQWYYHTGKVAITVKNKRTGITYSAAQTVTGGVATAAVTVPVLPGDVLSYTETQQVYCPVTGVWGGPLNIPGFWEIAFTQFELIALQSSSGTKGTWIVANDCPNTGLGQPDYTTGTITDTLVPAPAFWNVYAACYSLTGSQPWLCVAAEQIKYTTVQPLTGCTYNP